MNGRDPEGGQPRAHDDRPDDELAKALVEYPADDHSDPGEPSPRAAPADAVAAQADWRVAKSLLKLREQVNARFPNRSKASDGTIGDAHHCPGTSDHCASVNDNGVGVVTAMDITHDPAHGCNAGDIAEALRTGRDPRIKYIISNGRIANFQPVGGAAAFEWRDYGGPNPHNKHFHLSVRGQKNFYDATDNWDFESA